MSLRHNAFAALALLATLACADQATEPGQTYAVPAIRPKLVLPPGLTPASFGLVIDSVQIVLHQIDTTCWQCDVTHPDTILTDTVFAWPASQESFSMRMDVAPPPVASVYEVMMALKSGGTVLFSGYQMVDFRSGDIRLPPIPLYYSGPGSNAEDIQLAPGDTALALGDTLHFVATAYAAAAPLDTAYISWRVSDTTVARIDHLGHLTLRTGALGSSFLVTAAIPSGVTAATRISVPNPATALQKVSGDSQSAPVGLGVATPLVVRVTDAQGKPVAGARVSFFPVGAAGVTLGDTALFTDLQGLARTGVAPTAVRVDTVRAAVNGTALTTDFILAGTKPAGALPILFASDSGLSGFQLYHADSLGNNRQVIGYLGSYGLEWTAPRWNPARNRVAYTTYNGQTLNFDLRLTTAIGDTTATLVSDAYASDARFSPTGKMIAFFCGNLGNALSVADVCTVNAVDGDLTALNGTGNGAGRVQVSAVVPGRPYGAAGFAWRPDASTRIAFVRDTVIDSLSTYLASRFYQTNGDGTNLTALSPKVMDLGGGPLHVQGGIDWSPDGSTIVFSATDTTDSPYTVALYLLDVPTGTVRRFTTPPPNWTGDLYPRFSPDGQRVLFRRVWYYGGTMYMDYYVQRVGAGSPTRITYAASNWTGGTDPYYVGGDWSPDGASVVVTAPSGLGGNAAYRIPIDVSSAADYAARRILVGTANIAGLRDVAVSWGP